MPTDANTDHVAKRIATQYVAAWNELNAIRRRELIADSFTADAHYTDPMTSCSTHAGIDAMIIVVQGQFPGLLFKVHGIQDGHHNVARFSWALGAAGATPVAYGTDVVELAEDGRIRNVIGFLDSVSTPVS